MNQTKYTISLENYLAQKDLTVIQKTDAHLIIHCPFNGCDKDSVGTEAHCHITNDTEWLYNCFKCSESGNRVTFMRFFGDGERIGKVDGRKVMDEVQDAVKKLAENPRISEYLKNERGLSDGIIKKYKLGYNYTPYKGKDFRNFIYIPIFSPDGKTVGIKLRQDPKEGKDRLTYPKGISAQLYGKINKDKDLFICEGELDALVLIDRGHCAVTSTAGSGHWSAEWNEHLKIASNIYIVQDNDESGRKGSEKILSKLWKAGFDNLYFVTLPEVVGEKGDVTDYVVMHKLDISDLKNKYSSKFPSLVPTEELIEMTILDIEKGLDPTIKYDNVNKVICFLGMQTAYLNDGSQQNILFNALSSTGKSHTALEVSKLFPPEDIFRYDACSKKAFYHESGGEYDKEKNERILDFTGKIMIFTDQPRPDLMAELRPLLSHDNPELIAKITDKNQEGSNSTKTVILRGFPVFVYCTANSKYDEQEATRFIVLSPEIRQEKLQAGVTQSIQKESNSESFKAEVLNNPDRQKLSKRVNLIKYSRVQKVIIENTALVEEKFKKLNTFWKPRHQRDNKKIIGLIKSLALLNFFNRNRQGDTIFATIEDINNGFSLWESIYISQELGVSPYLADIYQKIIIPEFETQKLNWKLELNSFQGIDRTSICRKYKEVFNTDISAWKLRQEILFTLESTGLIEQVIDETNKRNKLVKPIYKDMAEPEVGLVSLNPYCEVDTGVEVKNIF